MGAKKDRFPVTIDIMGKKDTFIISPQGKALTPPLRGFTSEDIARLKASPSRQFTMRISVPDPTLVAASALKSAYLAMFSLFEQTGGYNYVGGAALRPIRQLIRDPFPHASASAGSYVTAVPKDDIPPDADIMLVTDPHPCWVVRVHDHHVFLPLDWDGTERAPLKEWYVSKHGSKEFRLEVMEYWPFRSFGTLTTVPVHLQGADRVESLVGRTVDCRPPGGELLRGVCVRHNGESAVLLCGEREVVPEVGQVGKVYSTDRRGIRKEHTATHPLNLLA